MERVTKKIKTVRGKLFFTLCVVVLSIILFLILVNSFVLEKYYQYAKSNQLKSVYNTINSYYNGETQMYNLEEELKKISIKNNFDIIVKNQNDMTVYLSNKDFLSNIKIIIDFWGINRKQKHNVLEENDKLEIRIIKDTETKVNYILLSGKLDNNYGVYIRTPISSIQESVRISNRFLYLIASIVIIIGGIAIIYISKTFSSPISELNNIAKRMANLDFSHKYNVKNEDDEINELGESINLMSDKLERTINQLRNTNIELEKDIEKKSKIDEMRKSFISDVSHELKTPIALIQGYSEGLLENVNTDEESRKFYAEVILDETNKMDKMVRQLIELTKLEYEKREFNNRNFNIVELEKEIVRTSRVMLEEKQVQVEFETEDSINVFADDMYISQIITNYLTNAIKHVLEVEGEKYIKITNKILENNKVKVTVFNTGNNISEENLNRVWNRFFKADEARNRDDGGSGIGLSIVKAIMNNYGNDFGVKNKLNGVEFYFEVDCCKL